MLWRRTRKASMLNSKTALEWLGNLKSAEPGGDREVGLQPHGP